MEPAAVIAFNQPIADAYVQPARNVALPSMPGRQVKFLQGHAVIKDGRDLVAMMRRPEVKLILTPYAMSWMETFMAAAGENIRAEVQWPEQADKPLANWDPSYRGTDRSEPGT
jgi:hypothetical protein